MKLSLQTLLVGVSLLSASPAYADVILHAFNWNYSEITAKATEIQQAGYKKVLIAPPMKSSGEQWWAGYQPQDLRLIDHPRGNKQQLQTLIQTMTSKGIQVYADVVLNHMANESAQRSDLNYPGLAVLSSYQANWTYANNQKLYGDLTQNFLSGSDFHAPGCISNYLDVWQVQYYRLCGGGSDTGLPDLDNNNWVIAQQQAYLQALKNMGIKGFRVDAVKHMTNAHINAVFTPALLSGMHVFGEVITSGGSGNQEYELFLKPYLDNTSHSAYDFPLFASMRNAFSFGGSMSVLVDPGAYGQALAWNKAVTFAITHDIPTNDGFRYQIMNSTDETLAHAYILGRNGGTPMIYSDHGETANLDGYRWQDFYKRADIKNMIRFHNSTQGSGMQVLGHGQCFLLFKRDKKGIVGINKCDTPQEYWVDTYANELNWYVNYTDVISGNSFQVNTQWLKVTIPARSARMWLQQ
ncbi:alpha-amylase family protein [uncultured Rheinheimera sp.]|uniref:alpha-amylase family protein n=1 Tax=uncultured Rheinheimera sp. TaxID=400532 RepID=UPI0025985A23|nr:alpha-amylase family protein [uncultured Rheinheimera sp.]